MSFTPPASTLRRSLGPAISAVIVGGVVVSGALAVTEVGTSQSDRLAGTKRADVLKGKKGRDVLVGGRGADILIGGGGPDRLNGGPQRDGFNMRNGVELPAPGRDRIDARDGGNDEINCGSGRDVAIVDATEDAVIDCERVREPPPEAGREGGS